LTTPVEKFKTFSPVLDKLLGGGLPRAGVILFEFSPYAPSLYYATNLLLDGLKKGECGVYITFDHSPQFIRHLLENHGVPPKEFEDSRKLFIVDGFRWGEKQEPYFIRDPSSFSEVLNVFSQIRSNAVADLQGNCRCVVDSTISLFFGYGTARMVSFELLIREVSAQIGIATIMLSPFAIGRQYNEILGSNSDGIIEVRSFEEGERLVHKFRIRKMPGQEPSRWVRYELVGSSIILQDE
jgi:KaiC/GvpD/RAD55 family RecA-like ATPase